MDGNQFDRLARGIAGRATRRAALSGLLGGLLLPWLSAAGIEARDRQSAVRGEKKRKKKCQAGLTTCTIKKGKKKKKLCVDAQTDPANCGGCGLTCASGQSCQGGRCTCNGSPCTGCCDGATCQAGSSDQQCGVNGGVCQVCSGGRSCQGGACTCPAGQTFCGGACVNLRTDASNCGACGNTCTLPQTCGGGNPGTPGVCGCTKTTCAAQGKSCGPIPDGCGGEINCGTCSGTTPICVNGTSCVACSLANPCPTGCCGAIGSCRPGNENTACGPAGSTCTACTGDTMCNGSGQCVQALHNFVCTCTNGAGLSGCTQLACSTPNVTTYCGSFCTSNGFQLDMARSSCGIDPC